MQTSPVAVDLSAEAATGARARDLDESLAHLTMRERTGLALAVVTLALLINPMNLQARLWLRDRVFGGMPYWLDKMTVMCALSVLIWGTIGGLLLGRRGLSLSFPRGRREPWLLATASGLGLTVLGAAAFAIHGRLTWGPHLDVPGMLADVVSNFWEELIGRGAIFGLLLSALGRQRARLAMLISGALFCQGHLYHPPAMLLLTFVVGTMWCWMTLHYRSLWPGYVSHTVVDLVGGTLFA
jgi:membrane protease YdiL (CAAX protease family)